ncbi:MAG: ArnT family glycosyltransferase [Tropicimonas sp.]|uniref:ArnT family glycosyltransferase n=1 Tax=Tropicimonas sp. TaxID=2067044 RepID=UPI003A83EC31
MALTHEIEGPLPRQTPGARAFVICATLMAGFFLLNLPYAIWPLQSHSDEHYYAVGAARMMESGDYLVPSTLEGEARLKKPPLAYYYIVAGVSLFGQSLWATKLFWLLSATAVLGLTFALARVAGASVTGAGLAVAFLGGHRAFFRSATQHIPDMPLVLGVAVALLAFCTLLAGKGGGRRWLLYFLAYGGIAFAVLAKGALPLALLGAYGAARLWQWRAGQRMPAGEGRVELAAALTAALAAGWWFALVWRVEPGAFAADFFGDQVTGKVSVSWLPVLGNLRKLTTDILGPGILFALVLLPGRRRPFWPVRGMQRGAVLLLGFWIVAVFGIFAFASVLFERYVLPALPAVAVLCALTADAIPVGGLARRLRRAVYVAFALTGIVAIACGVVLLSTGYPAGGVAMVLGAPLACGLLWRAAPGMPAWGLAGLLGATYPLFFMAMMPLHFTFGMPTQDQFAASLIARSGIPGERVWLMGSRKNAGRIGVLTRGVADWHFPAEPEDLPETGPAIAISSDPDQVAVLEARGFEVHPYRAFSLEKLTLGEAFGALRDGRFEEAGREGGPFVAVGIRR